MCVCGMSIEDTHGVHLPQEVGVRGLEHAVHNITHLEEVEGQPVNYIYAPCALSWPLPLAPPHWTWSFPPVPPPVHLVPPTSPTPGSSHQPDYSEPCPLTRSSRRSSRSSNETKGHSASTWLNSARCLRVRECSARYDWAGRGRGGARGPREGQREGSSY